MAVSEVPGWYRRYWLVNALVFELGWFVCVLLGTAFALPYTVLAVVLHFTFAPRHRLDALAVCIALPIGVVHDNLLWYFGVLDFSAVSELGIAPIWLLCLWTLLPLTFNHSLRWFYGRPWLLALMGAIGGPLAYFGGVALSGAQWGMNPVPGLLIMSAVWFCVLPLHRWLLFRGGALCARR